MFKNESNENGPIVSIIWEKMKTKIPFVIGLLIGMLLITSCNGLTGPRPTSTQDPCPIDVLETIIYDFEDLKQEINALAAVASETPVGDLEPIVRRLSELKEEIKGYEFPLCAARAQSALQEFSLYTEQCYFIKYVEYINENSGVESIADYDDFDRCDWAQLHEEAYDLMIQQLNELIATK